MATSLYVLERNSDNSQRMGYPDGDYDVPPEPLADPVTDLSAIPVGENQINVGWSATANAVQYLIWRSPDNANWEYIDLITGTAYYNTGLTADTLYYYLVWPLNVLGQQTTSGNNTASATTDAEVEPPPPTDSIPVNQLYEYRTISVIEDGDPDATGRNRSQPTTLENAMITAAAGDIVGIAAGVYVGDEPTEIIVSDADRTKVSAFYPRNNGDAGNPIVFVAENLATQTTTQAEYSEIKSGTNRSSSSSSYGGWFGDTHGTGVIRDGWGAIGSWDGRGSHVMYVGLYTDSRAGNNNMPFEDTGSIIVREISDVKVLHCKCYGETSADWALDNANNYSGIRVESASRIEVADCFSNGFSKNSPNAPGIMLYKSRDFHVHHNYAEDCSAGVYPKAPSDRDAQYPNQYGILEYNHSYQCTKGFDLYCLGRQTDGTRNKVRFNLSEDCDSYDFMPQATTDRPGQIRDCDIHNNTMVGFNAGDYFKGAWYFHYFALNREGDRLPPFEFNNTFYKNIISAPSEYSIATTGSGWETQNFWDGDDNTFDTPKFMQDKNRNEVTLASWRSAWNQELNSDTSDPQFVGGRDFRLQGGSPATGRGCYVTGNEVIGIRDGNEGSGIESQ